MAGEWSTATVLELQQAGVLLVEDGNHGEYRPRPDEFVADGVAFIRAADMEGGRVLFDTASKINKQARARITKGIGAPGDILISHKGTVGKVATVPIDAPLFVCSPQTTFWRSMNSEKLDPKYLYAFLRSPEFHEQLANRAGETDMAPYVSLTSQRSFSVSLPPIEVQRGIADLLCALDDKIELNRRMAETLEAMARALFRSWFVDFGPVRAKAEGRPTGLPDDLAALFPDSFDNDGLPSGWTRQSLGELFEVSGGNTPSTANPAFWNGPHQWATPKDLSSLTSPVLLQTDRQLSDAGLRQCSSGLLPPRSLLLSSRAPIGYMAFTISPTAINQGFAGIIRKETSTAYAWGWCDANMDVITGNAGGSTFPEISKSVFRQLLMLVPSRPLLQAFGDAAEPLIARIVASVREQESLASLRDGLLPKLISGELRIANAEKRISAA